MRKGIGRGERKGQGDGQAYIRRVFGGLQWVELFCLTPGTPKFSAVREKICSRKVSHGYYTLQEVREDRLFVAPLCSFFSFFLFFTDRFFALRRALVQRRLSR